MSSWCDDVIKILAEQPAGDELIVGGGSASSATSSSAVDTCKSAFEEINDVLHVTDIDLLPRDVTESCDSTELLNLWQDTEKRVAGVKRLCERRLTSMKKGLQRLNDRPVQKVEPTTAAAVPATTPQDANKMMNNSTSPQSTPKTTPKRNSAHVKGNVRTTAKSSTPKPAPKQTPPNYIDDKLRHVMEELVSSERAYIKQLFSVLEGYVRRFEQVERNGELPTSWCGKRDVIFGNLEEIHDFHSETLLPAMEENSNFVAGIANLFISNKHSFQMYGDYCRNSSRSEQMRNLMAACEDSSSFLQRCQLDAGHALPLAAYLLKPIQRITKYQLLLEQMVKNSHEECREVLQCALDTMLQVTKSINDRMHEAAISGYNEDMKQLGNLLLQGAFTIQVERRKEKSKKSRFSGKSLQRHVFLYEKELMLCKQQCRDVTTTTATNNNNNMCEGAILLEGKEQVYQYKRSIKWPGVEVSDAVGDKKRFEIWCANEVITIALPSATIRHEWMKQIRTIVMTTNRRPITPASSTKVRRAHSQRLSPSPLLHNNNKPNGVRHLTTVSRSPSAGRKSTDKKNSDKKSSSSVIKTRKTSSSSLNKSSTTTRKSKAAAVN